MREAVEHERSAGENTRRSIFPTFSPFHFISGQMPIKFWIFGQERRLVRCQDSRQRRTIKMQILMIASNYEVTKNTAN